MTAFVGLSVALAGCNGAEAAGDDVAGSESAQRASFAFVSGAYEAGQLEMVVANGKISVHVHVHDQIGSPGAGGATCRFTFGGRIEGDRAKIVVQSGWQTINGTLEATAGSASDAVTAHQILMKLDESPGGCARSFATRLEEGQTFAGSGRIEPGIIGFRSEPPGG